MKQIILFITVGSFIVCYGCKKMDDTYRSFVEKGETIYIAKADSLKAFSGKNRVELNWLLISDPKVKGYKIYWNNKKDSLEGVVHKTDKVDTVKVTVENLEEGIHYFEVFLYGRDGDFSMSSEVIGSSYGDSYQRSLLPRIIREAKWLEKIGMVEIDLTTAGDDIIGMEIEYENKKGENITHTVDNDIEIDTLFNVGVGSSATELRYRTLFLPDSTALDTFYTDFATTALGEYDFEVEIDKSNWKILKLGNDVYEAKQASRYPEMIFDGIVDPAFIAAEVPNQYPHSISIDFGEKVLLKHIRKNDYWKDNTLQYLYERGSPRIYEVWGSNNPTMDGDWSKWTLLGSFESVKPSGGEWSDPLTEEDIEAGKEGELFPFEDVTEAYRYVRFKTIETWRPTEKSPWIAELTFYGILQQ